ncbi:MAG: CDP-alcohol phosphatidyltransferase family protein [Candidatus Thorarchaeota archaeon]
MMMLSSRRWHEISPSRFRVRGIFRGAVTKAAQPLIHRNIHPDSVTYLMVLMALMAFLILTLLHSQVFFGLFVFLVGFLDGVDGMVARAGQRSSRAGGFTDSFLDKVSEAILLLGIGVAYESVSLLGLSISIWIFLCLAGWLLTSYSRSRAESLGVKDLDIGIGARSERLLTLVIFSLLSLLQWGLVVVTLLGLSTAAYRFYHYKRELEAISQPQDHHT